MNYDQEGFLYPFIDDDKCINCGLCYKKCPLKNVSNKKNDIKQTRGGYVKDETILKLSSSGGFASSLSNYVVESNGIVFGVRYDETFKSCSYDFSESKAGLLKFAGSKYIQSEKKDIYLKVKEFLDKGKLVLFTGCPCDVNALHSYLSKDYDNLILCELFCMGVTSNKILEAYIDYKELKEKSELVCINMRSKKNGWFIPTLEEHYRNGEISYSPFYSSYLGFGFLHFSRPSCYSCVYRGKNSYADLKIGDLWGAKKGNGYWNPNGMSCVLSLTDKGTKIMELLSDSFYSEVLPNSILLNNASLFNDNKMGIEARKKYLDAVNYAGIKYAFKQCASYKSKIKNRIPMWLQPALKHVIHRIIDK
jgi:coenzyme F420-reducing hydrogenase beta subunit